MLTAENFAPYFHSTTVVALDDNVAFLESLGQLLPRSMSFEAFVDVDCFLDRVSRIYQGPLEKHLRSGRPGSAATYPIPDAQIRSSLETADRFKKTSVLLLGRSNDPEDRDCEKLLEGLAGHPAQKILLAESTDHTKAVHSFNSGVIDRYIAKDDRSLMEKLTTMVTQLAKQQFIALCQSTTWRTTGSPPLFIGRKDIELHLEKLIDEDDIVEYYVTDDYHGILALSHGGEPQILLVVSERDLLFQIGEIKSSGGSPELIRRLEGLDCIPYYKGSITGNFDPEVYDWWNHLFSATRINDGSNAEVLIAQVKKTAELKKLRTAVFSLSKHQAQMDFRLSNATPFLKGPSM